MQVCSRIPLQRGDHALQVSSQSLEDLSKLRKLRGYLASYSMCIIKTWTNSWVTSSRFHESTRLPCIFGCDAKDELKHYVVCEPFWTIIHNCTGARAADLATETCVLICTARPTLASIRRLFVAYRCYHKLRFENGEEINRAKESTDFGPVIELLCAYARCIAFEHHLHHR